MLDEDFLLHPDEENFEHEESEEVLPLSEDEMYEHLRIVVDKGQTAVRLDKYLSDRLPKLAVIKFKMPSMQGQ